MPYYPPGITFGNPTNPGVNLTGSNGTATSAMRSDVVLVLDVTPAYAFSGLGATTISQAASGSVPLTISGYSLTGSQQQSMVSWAAVLNTSGSPDVFKIAVTDTARGANTRLLNLYAGASGTTSVLAVDRLGQVLGPQLSLTSSSGNLYLSAAANADVALYRGSTLGFTFTSTGIQPNNFNWSGLGDASHGWTSLFLANGALATNITQLTSAGTATLQLGALNAASPVAQTLQAQGSRAGTDSNIGGADFTNQSGQGTGTGTGSSWIVRVPALVASGSGAQMMTEVARAQGGGTPAWKWSANNSTGAGAALLGANSPAVTLTAPYTWIQCISSDGSVVYFPVWK